jgi:hypothetical protein
MQIFSGSWELSHPQRISTGIQLIVLIFFGPENLAPRDRAKKYNQAMEKTRGTQDFEAERSS